MERLDRGLCNRPWRNLFPHSVIMHLDFWGSDHRPLLLTSDTGQTPCGQGRRFFFEECWIDDEGCKEVVSSTWKTDVSSNGVVNVLWKIDKCGTRLSRWNMDKMRDLRYDLKQKREALREVNQADVPAPWKYVNSLESQLNEVLEIEERYWRQRAKVEWIQNGDRNIRFFHSKASARKAKNRINGFLDEGGIWRDSMADMKLIAGRYFSHLFTTSNPSQGDVSKVMDGIQPRLRGQTSRFLEARFSGEEILAIFEMKPMSAPGCDGLPVIFYQKFWNSVGLCVTKAFLGVLNDGDSVEGMNNTIISLIPKIPNTVNLSDYRPISLCNVLYKIIAKTITNRFKLALRDVISETQCAFVPGRLISDNTIVGFECLHRLKRRRRKKGSMAIKLDMSKAYDRVEWSFLSGMMQSLGFPEKWVELVMICVTSVSYSFLLNGEVCGKIKPSRGLRQGDPISPFLFLFCTEGFSSLIQREQEGGRLSGFQCSRGGPTISHLFFADDSLLFSKANEGNCVAVKNILETYARASCQLINFSKSAVCVSPSMSIVESERIASMIGVKLVDCHENYLGLPCFSGRSKRKLFAHIVDRVWGKIRGWGEKFLSIGSKEVLLKAVVQAIPAYAMSLFRIPNGLLLEIHRLCARFWWGGDVTKR
ncbi:hypothetical protein Dsin_021553 [Dipteronia sinensis]|uniref:Reverse transcriptase domain-containing protein n=1 Tax=Dipteronia sinensis TaxID=43782 RepID=A0AAE0A002_9ROSI|nr:hypothetical protein Dsin_021553 [Dipteronia sinensis]